MSANGLIVGAARSGSGKTSVTIGLLRAFARRGIAVGGAKSGPDYIDPGFPRRRNRTAGCQSRQLGDAPVAARRPCPEAAAGADLIIVESAMGLFDGILGEHGRSGAASDLARLYRLPVLLVLDVSGQSQTAAAIAKGFATYDPGVTIGGVVLNRVASERHRRLAAEAIEAIGLPVVGAIMRDPTLSLPERHLGLVQASEHADLEAFIERLADVMEKSLDLDAVLALAAPFDAPAAISRTPCSRPGQRIALAEDAAFTFVYPHVAAEWRRPAPSWCRSRRSPTSRRRTIATPAGCRAAIRNCMPAARGGRQFPRRHAALRGDAAGPRRVRRLHGARQDTGRCRWRDSRNARPARPCHQLRQAPHEPRLPASAARGRLPARRRPARRSAAMNSTTRK